MENKSSANSDFTTPSRINLDRPSVGADDDVGRGGGPTHNSGGATDALASIYRHHFSSPASSCAGGGPIFGSSSNFQSYDIYPPSCSAIPYKSAGGEMGFPFTAAQWKELERQAMIYKCMISSVPVPPHLLLPLSRNFSATPLVDSSVPLYTGRYSRNGDPEPGRCKRTDGKKWRCAREVAPHQKYCERHLHRGRPRSRKPVEPKNALENHKKTRLENNKSLPNSSSSSQPLIPRNEFLNAKTDLSISSLHYKREMGLTTTEAEFVSSEPPWENMMGLENCYFPQPYAEQIEPLNLFSYPNFPAPEIDLPSGFIDAWSIDNPNARSSEPSISLNDGDLSPSLNLSMAMAAGNNIVDREKDSVWASGVCWEPFARGGPLGEALQPVGGSNPTSPYHTPATTVSSPSGVLHWTLFSQSDSSVCNSPTFVGPPAEALNQWHN